VGNSTGSVNGFNNVGGLVGYNHDGTISNSYLQGSVNGSNYVGGLVGFNMNGTITNAYAKASATGNNEIGGLVGHNNGTVSNSYSTGSVTGTNDVGGLVGFNMMMGTITNSFWDKTIFETDNGLGTGKTTAEMKQQSTFTDWDFDYIWAIDETTNDGYPHFDIREAPEPPVAKEPSTIIIEEVTYYQIASLENLIWLSENSDHWDKHYIQTAENIDAETTNLLDGEAGFTPIGTNNIKFTGTYDGQGNTISNLFIDRPNTDNVGLFGYV